MSIYVWTSEIKNIYVWTTPVKEVYMWTTKVRPSVPPYLCFTANTAWSTVKLNRNWSPAALILETSTDLKNWSDYTIWDTITLSNIWDKVYWRNTSEITTWFSTGTNNYYKFVMTWSIAWSWNTNYLLNKNSTLSVSRWCYYLLFNNCTSLTTTPTLPATNTASACYYQMFYWCSNLTTLPSLPATTLDDYCYYQIFGGCSKIKMSTTKTGEYQTAYRIPTTWTWTTGTNSLYGMFDSTSWTFNWPVVINTTYYTSNEVV